MADNAASPFIWGEAISETLTNISQQLVNYAPQVIGATAIMLLGWAIAHGLAISSRKLVNGLDILFARVTRSDTADRERIKSSYALIVSKVVFWVVMIFFFAVAANILDWDLFSTWFDSIFTYLPGLITGLIILLGGFLLSNVAKTAIITTAQRAGIQQSAVMAKVVQVAIIFSSIIIGVEQIGLNIGFLSNIIVVVIAILLAGAVLAFSLGARTLVANVIGAQFTRRHCVAGDYLKVGDAEGEVLEISQASIVLQTSEGKLIIPAKYFHEQVTLIRSRQ